MLESSYMAEIKKDTVNATLKTTEWLLLILSENKMGM